MMDKSLPCLPFAQLDWDEHNTPQSSEHGDIYFSRDNGLEETRYVFLAQNKLAERWQKLSPGSRFVIAETGFGTGLNFLCAWSLWRSLPGTTTSSLHFVSFEKHPLMTEDLTRALSQWQTLLPQEVEALVEQYPPPLRGIHRLSFELGRVKLTLIFGDAVDGLQNNHFLADAWFLDGFAPDKNPTMWNDTLLSEIARHSTVGTTLSTFTSVGRIRRGLQEQGFHVVKVPGFGKKREMLTAALTSQNPHRNYPEYFTEIHPWGNFCRPPVVSKGPVVIIGGGLAGAWSAFALAERGIQVTLIERRHRCGDAASGNPQGILYCKPGRQYTLATQLGLHGCLYSVRAFNRLTRADKRATPLWSHCGTYLLATNKKAAEDQDILKTQANYPNELLQHLSREQISSRVGTQVAHGGMLLGASGWASPGKMCRYLAQHPNITRVESTQIDELRWIENEQRWELAGKSTSAESLQEQWFSLRAENVIIASAHEAERFQQTQGIPIKKIRGQITQAELPAHTQERVEAVVCGDGYVCPPKNSQLCFGATFNLKSDNLEEDLVDHKANIDTLASMTPALAEEIREQPMHALSGRVGFRCTIPDYMPVVGPIPENTALMERFSRYRHHAQARIQSTGSYLPGLFINIGHGSKGLSTCPLSAEIIAAYLLGEPMPVTSALLAAIHPARFTIKKLKRNEI